MTRPIHRAWAGLSAFAIAALATAPLAAEPAPDVPAITGNHNLEGVWKRKSGGQFGPTAQRGDVKYTVYPYTPEFQKDYDRRIDDEVAGRPVQTAGADCLPSGLGRMMTGGGPPVEIFQTAREVIVRKENGGLHRIRLYRDHLPTDDLFPMFYGDSVGHWEGDTLVVDTISLGAQPFIDGRAVYSDQAHIVERYRRVDKVTLEVNVTITDPKAFTKPITATALHTLQPDYEMQEYYCTNERHRQGAGADQSVIGVAPAAAPASKGQ
ncbi:hypothetical protein H7F51_00695 [Novosphingobium flavum]|uniref:Uncharacterized protein n=1 Tax=Novosphingobium flavum TaxID=1778672 RepID=A0A7X1FPK7_9SPHN|nr:hypothetical protein [Novosphingobium flavum]MBC2664027.1 hypothetical protein [Novosphingobium flavum]